MNFEEAFKRFARRLEMPFACRLAEEIAEAAKHGGDMTLVFDMTAKYAENLLTWEEDRSDLRSWPFQSRVGFE